MFNVVTYKKTGSIVEIPIRNKSVYYYKFYEGIFELHKEINVKGIARFSNNLMIFKVVGKTIAKMNKKEQDSLDKREIEDAIKLVMPYKSTPEGCQLKKRIRELEEITSEQRMELEERTREVKENDGMIQLRNEELAVNIQKLAENETYTFRLKILFGSVTAILAILTIVLPLTVDCD